MVGLKPCLYSVYGVIKLLDLRIDYANFGQFYVHLPVVQLVLHLHPFVNKSILALTAA